jgi:hypothetical protein
MAVNYWGKGAIELRYADCPHMIFIPQGHTADHQHCYACHPELAEEPRPRCCNDCQTKRDREASENAEPILRRIGQRWPDGKPTV